MVLNLSTLEGISDNSPIPIGNGNSDSSINQNTNEAIFLSQELHYDCTTSTANMREADGVFKNLICMCRLPVCKYPNRGKVTLGTNTTASIKVADNVSDILGAINECVDDKISKREYCGDDRSWGVWNYAENQRKLGRVGFVGSAFSGDSKCSMDARDFVLRPSYAGTLKYLTYVHSTPKESAQTIISGTCGKFSTTENLSKNIKRKGKHHFFGTVISAVPPLMTFSVNPNVDTPNFIGDIYLSTLKFRSYVRQLIIQVQISVLYHFINNNFYSSVH